MPRRKESSQDKIISTDPPYYDNIGYADLSDFSTSGCVDHCGPFFQVFSPRSPCQRLKNWSRRRIATAGKEKAEAFFLRRHDAGDAEPCRRRPPDVARSPSTTHSSSRKRRTSQAHRSRAGRLSWRPFIRAGFQLTGTWPMRTERDSSIREHRDQRSRVQHRSRLPQASPMTRRPFPAASFCAS